MLRARPFNKRGIRKLGPFRRHDRNAHQQSVAVAVLAELQEQSKLRFVSPASAVAVIFAALGDKGQAFAWLEKAEKASDRILVRLKVDSRFDSLRSDPRFADLLRRLVSRDKIMAHSNEYRRTTRQEIRETVSTR
jgi:hypothetical protein